MTTSPSVTRLPRVGCLGLGWIGCHRLRAVADAGQVAIVGIADPDAEARARATAVVPDALAVRNLPELLDLDLDGLMIATPSALHAEQTIAALARGVSVFAQKPLARSREETALVLDTARQVNRLLAVDFSYQFAAAPLAVAAEIASGRLGQVYAADFTFHNAYGPDRAWFYDRAQSGGGCLIDLGSHLIDLALSWLEGPVTGVSSRLFAQGRPLADGASLNEDYASVRLDLASGCVVTVACSWRLPTGQEAVIEGRCYGTRGGAGFTNVGGSFYNFRADRLDGTRRTPLAEPPDEWGGRAAVDWAERLAAGERFDPGIDRLRQVAGVLDEAYADAISRTGGRERAARPQPGSDAAGPDGSVRGRRGAAPDAAGVS